MKVWLARNRRNNKIHAFLNLPCQFFIAGIFLKSDFDDTPCIELDDSSFSDITWENSPKKITILPKYKNYYKLFREVYELSERDKPQKIIKKAIEDYENNSRNSKLSK